MFTVEDLRHMTAAQIAAFAAYEEETQTDNNQEEEWDWYNDPNYVGSRWHY